MRLVVTGGRDYGDRAELRQRLEEILWYCGIDMLIHGGCPTGADAMAGRWAEEHAVPILVFAADWDRYGKRAGPLRNREMIRDGAPDLVLAFPGGRGTADCIAAAREYGISVTVIPR